jgi:hypothetical protein
MRNLRIANVTSVGFCWKLPWLSDESNPPFPRRRLGPDEGDDMVMVMQSRQSVHTA